MLALAMFTLWSSGCARKNEEYVPSREAAEVALVKALESWRAGKPAGEVEGTKPVVFATDTSRKEAQVLVDYKVLGETPGTSGRTYVVVLDLKNPAEEIKTQYVVVGIDPLWVFRQEDYELLMHWDHYMPDARQPASTTSTSAPSAPVAQDKPDAP